MKSAALAMVLALGSTGCAALFTKPVPRDWDGASLPACSTSNGWGRLDAVVAVASGLAALIVLTDDTETAHDFSKQGSYALVPMVVFGASSVYGWRVTARCRHARAGVSP